MATTFNVFFLGIQNSIDRIEGNTTAESADELEGLTIGSAGDPLFNRLQTFSPGDTRFDQPSGFLSWLLPGGSSSDRRVYNQDNSIRNETFKINDGPNQVFDAGANYTATVTYTDGTTDNITAVVFQDTQGRTYLSPPQTADENFRALTAKPIRSIKLNEVIQNTFDGLAGDRPDLFKSENIPTCYVSGTLIRTATGNRPIETLAVGEMVLTKDHGPRAIRWIGGSTVQAIGKLAPIRIRAGALGKNIPARDLLVSRQHRMLVSSKICQRMFGIEDLLIPAIKLTALPGVEIEETGSAVTYFHLLTDAHDVIFAEGAASETMLTGTVALQALGPDYVAEIETIFPGITQLEAVPVRPIARGKKVDQLIARHEKNQMPLAC